MDPLSVATGCLALVTGISKLSITISKFVRDVRSARSDLNSVSQELLPLKTVLELLAEDAEDSENSCFPDSLRKQVCGIVSNCNDVVEELVKGLDKHSGSGIDKSIWWAMTGKDDIRKLRCSLEAHKSALDIALDMIALYVKISSSLDGR
jgi:hypothetical protein